MVKQKRTNNGEEQLMSEELTNYVTTKQASELLGIRYDNIPRILKLGGKLKGVRLGYTWLVYKPSIREYLETKSPKGRPPSHKPKIQKTT